LISATSVRIWSSSGDLLLIDSRPESHGTGLTGLPRRRQGVIFSRSEVVCRLSMQPWAGEAAAFGIGRAPAELVSTYRSVPPKDSAPAAVAEFPTARTTPLAVGGNRNRTRRANPRGWRPLMPTDIEGGQFGEELQLAVRRVVMNPPGKRANPHRRDSGRQTMVRRR
jgi:hypothetical protein